FIPRHGAYDMRSSLHVSFLIAGMLSVGAGMSLLIKYQDMQCVENCNNPESHNHVTYEQPVWQTLIMFVGEALCLLPVLYTRYLLPGSVQLPFDEEVHDVKCGEEPFTGWTPLLFWIPAIFDIFGATLMNVGLLYTPVSISQMTRGALVSFVGIFSVVFLRRRLELYQWMSLCLVVVGVTIVGLSGKGLRTVKESSQGGTKTINVLIGIFFILCPQIFTAIQFIIEEKIMSQYDVEPMLAVGLEGTFGILTVLAAMAFLSIPSISSYSVYLDISRGWHQLIDNPVVLSSAVAIAVSVSVFDVCGVGITHRLSATVRTLTDSCRTLVIWILSLGLGWEVLVWPVSMLQVLGFGLLVYGTLLYNGLVVIPSLLQPRKSIVLDLDQLEG
ncbi:hypothetical protein K443DRAFT_99530, partial [Laccaria amethystina LaAM-08-1]